jgi:hypothetical protein
MRRAVSIRRVLTAVLIGAIGVIAAPSANAAVADPPIRFCRALAPGGGWGSPFRCYSPPICYPGTVGKVYSPIYELDSTVGKCLYATDYGIYAWSEQ